MQVNLNEVQLEKIIKALNATYASKFDQYLIDYLESIKKAYVPSRVDLDESPF